MAIKLLWVAPFTGAWIEILIRTSFRIQRTASHPSRVRGLKSPMLILVMVRMFVAPFTGAWIEIPINVAVKR